MVEAAILRTILYADIFHFPLTLDELHYFLIHHQPVPLHAVKDTLNTSAILQTTLCQRDGYIALAHRDDIIGLRQSRDEIANRLLPIAHYYGNWLGHIPFVRMVALTGALSMNNPHSLNDDIDYLLIVEHGRVWLARAIAIGLVRLARLGGTELCPNYVVSTQKLTQARQDLYIAHEITQMVPLYGESVYELMMKVNQWAHAFLPNARPKPTTINSRHQTAKVWLERWLSGWLGNRLEEWEYRRKSARFESNVQSPKSSAEIDKETVKGHFNDHGQRVLIEYQKRLKEYGLLNEVGSYSGD